MILYFGNELSKYGFTPTTIEILSQKLREKYLVISASSIKNPIFRILHMVWVFITNYRQSKLILIDTYSTNAFYLSFIISCLARLFKKPYCPILHGGNLPQRLLNSPNLSRFIFNYSYENITPSLYLENEFNNLGYNTKYIPNFIDIKKYDFKNKIKHNPKLLWVRSFDNIYNPQMGVHVLSKLIKEFPDAKLCMVGPDKDGSMGLCKELSRELGLTKQVIFTGLLSKKEWISLSNTYDIFINTTNFDNMPVSIIEAMALGLPIVSTNAGGIKYLLEDKIDALLVNKNDINEMVKNISKLIKNSRLSNALSNNAQKKVKSFTWDAVKVEWDNIILSIID